MKFKAAQVDLSQAVQTVQHAVPARPPLPALAGILLTAQDNEVVLVATDHEIGIRCSAPAQVDDPGSIVLPARYLGDIVRKVPAGEVACEVDEPNLRALLVWQRSQFVVYGFAAREFPQLPTVENPRLASLPQRALRDLIRKTSFAVAREDIRPVLTGGYLELSAERAAIFATDGYRIAYAHVAGDFSAAAGLAVIVPGRALGELLRLLQDSEEPVEAAIGGNQLRFSFGGIEFSSRLIDGSYPNCRAVVPREYRASLTASTEEFLNACDRASLVAREGSQMVMLKLDGQSVQLNSQTPEVGSVQEEVAAQVSGDALEIAFSGRYLIEALRTVDTEQFVLELSGPASPARLRPLGTDDAYHIILPIRLD
jgi:DNA polymerase-3 subunit beta